MIKRNIDAAAYNDIITNKQGPLIGILYDERKIDIFRGETYAIK